MRAAVALLASLPLVFPASARAAGIDRDMLLTEAPAVPDKGTVRVSAAGIGQAQTEAGQANQSSVSGFILWAPFEGFAADVGAYYQGKDGGPSARVRYQFLRQDRFGVDLAGGVRFKTVGFHPDKGEVEFAVLAGRSFGNFEVVLNGVFGIETGGENGKDVEVRAFAGYRLGDHLKIGLDGRLQTEVEDESATAAPKFGRDFDLSAGPAVSWGITRQLHLQALVGVFAPKRTNVTSPGGVLEVAFDF